MKFLIQFIQDSLHEFRQVSWPSRADSRKYFQTVIIMIVVCTVVLALVGGIFREGLLLSRSFIVNNFPQLQFQSQVSSSSSSPLQNIQDTSEEKSELSSSALPTNSK